MAIKEVASKTEEPPTDSTTSSANVRVEVVYLTCQKNFALQPGRYVFDGCQEFMASDVEGTEGAFICHACGCNQSFHQMIAYTVDV